MFCGPHWRFVRWLVAGCILIWSGSPAFGDAIDDLYITAAFAHQFAATGRFAWTTGEVVEGMTSIPWMLTVAAAPVLGIDAAFWARACSLFSGLVILAALSHRASAGFAGTLLVWVVASWTSFSLWALSGFEMTMFAGCVALGWTATVEGRFFAGRFWLLLAALVRPEGWALAVAAAVLERRGTGTLQGVWWTGLALFAWCLGRFAIFGDLLPTPFLVKFVANPHSMAGVAQAAGDALVAAGPVAAFFLSTERRWAAALPLALGFGLLLVGDGDWFAAGRMTMAGVLTLAFVAAPRVSGSAPGVVILALCGVVSAFTRAPYGYVVLESGAVEAARRFIVHREPMADAFGRGLRTPLLEELSWLIRRVDGGCLLTGDVGMLGNVEGLCIRDRVGLVDRAFAEYNAGFRADPRETPGAGPIVAERMLWRGVRPEVPGMELMASWPLPSRGGWVADFWQRPDALSPAPTVVVERWRAIADRYPWQPELWWGWGAFASETGEPAVVATIRAEAFRWPRHPLAKETEQMISFVDRYFLANDYVFGRGFRVERSGERLSRPIAAGEELSLVVDADGGEVTLLVGWAGPGCGMAQSVVTTAKGAFALPAASCARLSVWFVDDGVGPEGDRNAYVSLRARESDDLPLPPATRSDVPFAAEPSVEWVPDRGWALWWNRRIQAPVLPAGTSVSLELDVDSPGDEGAVVTVGWEPPCDQEALRLSVHSPMTVTVRAPCSAQLEVAFTNDRSTPSDRNAYVRAAVVTPPPADITPSP